jgi:hypothetical protein
MTWEYDNPLASAKDEVRFLLGDTDESDQQFSDEEVDYLVTTFGDATTAAVAGARALAGRYARFVTKAVGDLRIEYSNRSSQYIGLAKMLAEGDAGSTIRPMPVATGIRISDKSAAYLDADRVRSAFVTGQDDDPAISLIQQDLLWWYRP